MTSPIPSPPPPYDATLAPVPDHPTQSLTDSLSASSASARPHWNCKVSHSGTLLMRAKFILSSQLKNLWILHPYLTCSLISLSTFAPLVHKQSTMVLPAPTTTTPVKGNTPRKTRSAARDKIGEYYDGIVRHKNLIPLRRPYSGRWPRQSRGAA